MDDDTRAALALAARLVERCRTEAELELLERALERIFGHSTLREMFRELLLSMTISRCTEIAIEIAHAGWGVEGES